MTHPAPADLVKELRDVVAQEEAKRDGNPTYGTALMAEAAAALTAKDAELADWHAVRDMLALCGEQEVRGVHGWREKLRALIDGLIFQRRRAESAESSLAQANERVKELEAKLRDWLLDVVCDNEIEEHPDEQDHNGWFRVGLSHGNLTALARLAGINATYMEPLLDTLRREVESDIAALARKE